MSDMSDSGSEEEDLTQEENEYLEHIAITTETEDDVDIAENTTDKSIVSDSTSSSDDSFDHIYGDPTRDKKLKSSIASMDVRESTDRGSMETQKTDSTSSTTESDDNFQVSVISTQLVTDLVKPAEPTEEQEDNNDDDDESSSTSSSSTSSGSSSDDSDSDLESKQKRIDAANRQIDPIIEWSRVLDRYFQNKQTSELRNSVQETEILQEMPDNAATEDPEITANKLQIKAEIMELPQSLVKDIQDKFEYLDHDNVGVLNSQQLSHLMEILGYLITEKEVEELKVRVGFKKDQYLQLAEVHNLILYKQITDNERLKNMKEALQVFEKKKTDKV